MGQSNQLPALALLLLWAVPSASLGFSLSINTVDNSLRIKLLKRNQEVKNKSQDITCYPFDKVRNH